jgi:hypothetical protein
LSTARVGWMVLAVSDSVILKKLSDWPVPNRVQKMGIKA